MKNDKISLLDKEQIAVRIFDESNDAQRVILVGSDGRSIAEGISSSVKDALKDIKIEVKEPTITTQQLPTQAASNPLVIKIPYQTIIKETEIVSIDKPIIIPEIKFIEIEKPIIVTEIKIIEVPVIVKELKPFPKTIIWLLFGFQLLINLLLIFHK